MVGVSEDPQPEVSPEMPVIPDVAPVSPDAGQDLASARTARLGDMVVSRLSDQARLTAQGAKARRISSAGGQPGMADMTPLRELFSDLVEEARRVRPRERIGRALRQAADVIDPPDH